MKQYHRGIFLVFMTAIISGVSIFVNKFGVTGIDPNLFAGLKNLSVGILLVAVLLAVRGWQQVKALHVSEWVQLALVGIIGGSVPFLLFFQGLAQTTGAKAGFIHKTMFVYVALLSVWFLKQKMSRQVVWGYLALVAGLVMFLGIKPQALSFGDLLVLLATIMWAVEIVIAKQLLKNVSANIVATARMLFGGLCIWLY